MPIRRLVVLSLLAPATLGCSGDPQPAAEPAAPAVAVSSDPGRDEAERLSPPKPERPATPRSAPRWPAVVPAAAPCRADDLAVTDAVTGAGRRARPGQKVNVFQPATPGAVGGVALRNEGTEPCRLVGRPAAALIAEDGTVLLRARPTPRFIGLPFAFPRRLLRALPPGRSARVVLAWANWCGPGSDPKTGWTDKPAPAALELDLPGGGGTVRVRLDNGHPACYGRERLYVTRFEPHA